MNVDVTAGTLAVQSAVKAGKLCRPPRCLRCDSTPWRVIGHHYLGYEPHQLLCVEWLCERCHKIAHRADEPDWQSIVRSILWNRHSLSKIA